MSISLNTLSSKGKKSKPRLGRGNASGSGTYSGRGIKGQKARSGSSGLKEMALRRVVQRIPKKRGFKAVRTKPDAVTVASLEKNFEVGAIITPKILRKKGLTKTLQVRIINTGVLKKKFSFKSCNVTAGARAAIEAAGGNIA